MKKVLMVLALVAVYGVSMAMSTSNVVTVENAKITIVADMDDSSVVASEGEKEKESKKAAKAEAKTSKSEGCAGVKTEAKSEGCAGTKEAKSDCASKCAEKEKK